jgi:isoleucyl-tRNA synthetase
MVQGRPDWCLSRQRYWGVPIPAVVCRDCGEHYLSPAILKRLTQRVVQEGTDVWFTAPVADFIPSGFACACGGTAFDRGEDILDVWFDSGVSHQAVLKTRDDLRCPADLYLEGSDQHRGWFQASLISSMAIDGQAPFKAVLTHGFVVDGEGRKMSKSMGNVVSPQDVLKDFGADILRLWVLSSDYNEDVRLSKHILESTADAYRKIRNTARFLLSNLYDFNPSQDKLPRERMLDIDRWALARYDAFVREVTDAYESYHFYVAFQRLFAFCNETLSSLYLDILKDRLYTAGAASPQRRSAQTALYEILRGLTALLAPVLPFTADEIHASTRVFVPELSVSVHLEVWPDVEKPLPALTGDYSSLERVLEMRPDIMKALEAERAAGHIGSSLEASVALTIKDAGLFADFKRYARDLRYFFIVSKFDILWDAGLALPFALKVVRAEGVKCVRCWNFSTDVGHNAAHPELCGRCVTALGDGE